MILDAKKAALIKKKLIFQDGFYGFDNFVVSCASA